MTHTVLHADDTVVGFTVVAVVPLPDYESTGIYLKHNATGLEVFHLLNDDAENLFAFAFRTPPENSMGAPHILEHSVLCGSQRFPLKDPFIRMANQSVKTFLNAATYPDVTEYPASSVVEADYFNLMAVYGDAVFFPLLAPWTFRQEAYRLEADDNGTVSLQGVVYNEMKGAYSAFDTASDLAVTRSLLGGTAYAHDSGGDPLHIPHFTYADFKAFHERYYHPSNCLLFLYGNIPTEKQLAFVEERFLQRPFVQATSVAQDDATARDDTRLPTRVEVAAPAGSETGATVLLNWLLGETADAVTHMEALFLAEVLMGHDASPLTRALLESGLGEDLAPDCGIDSEVKHTLLSVGLRGVKRRNAPQVEACVMDTLASLARDGIAEHDIAGATMAVDFENREIRRAHGPYALVLCRRVLRSWVHGGSPWACISPRESFAEVKRRLAADSGYTQRLIRTLLIDNPHRSLVTVYPDKQYNKTRAQAEQALIRELSSQTTVQTIRSEQAELTRLQQGSDDLPEDKAAVCMPHLAPKDLSPEVERIVTEAFLTDGGIPVFTNRENTNGIVYIIAGFPVDVLAPEDFALLPLFADALTGCGFAGKSWTDCGADIAVTTGGFHAGVFISSLPQNRAHADASGSDGSYGLPESAMAPLLGRAWLFVRIKVLAEKTDDALRLLAECLTTADFGDTKRLGDLAFEARNDARASVIPAGNEYVAARGACGYSTPKAIDELWNGVSQLFTLERITAGDIGDTAAAFRRIRAALVDAGVVLHLTADAEGFAHAKKALPAFVRHAGLHACTARQTGADRERDEAFRRLCDLLPWTQAKTTEHIDLCLAPSAQIGFACRSLPASAFGTTASVHESVFAHWLSNTLLWEQIRTVGGAYGAFAIPDSLERVFSLVTYRDPKPFRSLDVFIDCLAKAVSFNFDRAVVERAIVGTYSHEIQPRSPASKGYHGFVRALYGLTERDRVEKIERILAVTGADLHATAERLYAQVSGSVCAVIAGNRDARATRTVTLPS